VGLQGVGDVAGIGAELEAPEDEEPLGAVVVARVDLEVGGRDAEPAHPHDADGVDARPGPPPGGERAAQHQRVVVGGQAGSRPPADQRRDPDGDPGEPQQEPARAVEAARPHAQHHPREQPDGGDEAHDDRGDRCGPTPRWTVVRVVHRLRPQWGRTTSV
jgi:hypothetical protein